MMTLSGPQSVTTSDARSTPPVVHGLVYGVVTSMAMWVAIAAIASRFV